MVDFGIKALCFDVIGTAVDWRGTIVRELDRLGKRCGVAGDWAGYARAWARFYADGPIKSAAELAWRGARILEDSGLAPGMPAADIDASSGIWTRLDPWPDAARGLGRLRAKFRVAALTNCSLDTVTPLSAHAGLPWDSILSAESVGAKKPDPRVYAMAAGALGVPPREIMMVAAHIFDVSAARGQGFRTAYVQRRDDREPAADEHFDVVVPDFDRLADLVGA